VLHLCSVKKFSGAKSENWPILYRQNVMQETLLSIVSNLPSSSQAGRRGFDPRLPLQQISNLEISTHELSLQSLH